MIYVDFVIHCDRADCKAVEHIPVEEAIHGTTAHVAVQIPRKWTQGRDGVYCEEHGEAT